MLAVRINDDVLDIKEYQGQRVVTLADVDQVHKRTDGTARRNFNENKKRLIEGEDYFVRNSYEAKEEFGIIAPNGLTLLTESGYLMLVKSLNDDLAWQVQRQLVKVYFRAKESISATEDVRKIIREELTSIMKELFTQYSIPQLTLPASLESESDYLRYTSNDNDKKKKRRHYRIDTLKCKQGIIQLYLSGAKLKQIVEYAAIQGEFCSIASLSRYFNNKFRLARQNTDGSIELVEKSGGTVLYCKDGTQYIKSGNTI